MKKLVLLTISLLLFSSLALAHEASIYYPTTIELHQKFWHLNQIRLYWTGDDYAVDLDLTPVVAGGALGVKAAWKSLNLFHSRISTLKSIDLAIGKIVYPFGDVSSLASKNIGILQPKTFDSDLMAKLSGNICNTHKLIFYWADPGDPLSFYTSDAGMGFGFRAATTYIKGADIGASLRIRNAISDTYDALTDWGFDIGYTLNDMVKLDFQTFNLDDGDDNTDDLDLWFLATYVPGFNAPILNKVTPYGGYFSKSGMEEYNMIVGVNIQPKENAFVKLEYNLDSLDKGEVGYTNTSDALSIQVGFTF
ncbi:MAG: hypothetical protein U9R23_07255 [Candidatus Cloacimonadota bacterium]|nr:hypothetical protein [Candidatus Cloacimonadota bacterium]